MLKTTVIPEFACVPTGQPSVVHLLIKLETEPAPTRTERLPLNVCLVLDRSGSMAGDKLAYTKLAARHLIDRLQRSDTVSLVVYDDQVSVLSPPTSGGDKDRLVQQLERVTARGMTNLSGGWLKGLNLTAGCPSEGRVNRVLLMTDGLANQGATNPHSLAAIGRRFRSGGVPTTTLGFGAGFNEDLLTTVADQSGGNFYFIDSPEKAPAVFLEELGELSTILGQNLEVILRCEEGVTVETAYTPAAQARDVELRWNLNDLYADDVRLLLVSLRVPAGFAAAGRSPVAQVGVRYQQVRDGTGERRHELPANLVFAADAATTDPHPEVLRERLVMSAAQAKERAINLADRGRHEAAQEELRQCTSMIRARMHESKGLAADDLSLLTSEAAQCEDLESGFSRQEYGSTVSRKTALAQNYMASKQRGIYRKG